MGKQSARLYYQGNDHKDIYYRGNYHYAMYKGNGLMWEKMFPDEYFVLGNTYSAEKINGIIILEKNSKYYDFMRTKTGFDIRVYAGNGKVMTGSFEQSYSVADSVSIYSLDGKTWISAAELDDLSVLTQYLISGNNSFLSYSNDSYIFTIINFDDNGNFKETIKTDYESTTWKCAQGCWENYVFYKISSGVLYTDIVDINGETIASYSSAVETNYAVISEMFVAGGSIYGIGRRSTTREYYSIIKLNKETGEYETLETIDTYQNTNNSSMRFYDSTAISASDNAVVVRVQRYSVYCDIYVLKGNAFYRYKEASIDTYSGYVRVKELGTDQYYNLWYGNFATSDEGEVYLTITSYDIASQSLYIKEGELCIDKENGICVGARVSQLDTGEEQDERVGKLAIVYLDNMYFDESDGNFLIFTNIDV